MSRKELEAAVVDLTQAIGLAVRRIRAASVPSEISWPEAAVLKHLAREGPATTADLARAQGMKPQSMRAIVASLETLEMVVRKPHPTDGRQVNIELTSKGASAQKTSTDAKRTWLAHAIAELDKRDRQTLFEAGRILKRLASRDEF